MPIKIAAGIFRIDIENYANRINVSLYDKNMQINNKIASHDVELFLSLTRRKKPR